MESDSKKIAHSSQVQVAELLDREERVVGVGLDVDQGDIDVKLWFEQFTAHLWD